MINIMTEKEAIAVITENSKSIGFFLESIAINSNASLSSPRKFNNSYCSPFAFQ